MFFLRSLKEADASRMLEWLQNDSITSELNIGGNNATLESVQQFIESAKDETLNLHRAIVDENDNYLGTVSLKGIDLTKKQAEYAIVLHMDALGTGAAISATDAILRIAFDKLGLTRVFLCVRKTNKRAIHFYEKYGWNQHSKASDIDLLWYEINSQDRISIEHIIVQAGGMGSRMGSLTRNKPKALVPINNLPMLFHLFRKFPSKHFIIIGDYKYEVLKQYLHAFAEVDYKIISSAGKKGTCAGLAEAISLVPDEAGFMLTWCDLLLSANYELPVIKKNYIGISKDFPCRWSYNKGLFEEEKSSEHGVAGHFLFANKKCLSNVPAEGEFVRWLQHENLTFCELPLWKTKEYGLISEWEKANHAKCRPFNQMEYKGDIVIKRPLDEQGRDLAEREKNWYRHLEGTGFKNLPLIHTYYPFTLERIHGKNIYEYDNSSYPEKKVILSKIIECLQALHELEDAPFEQSSYDDAYITKTKKRLEKVKGLVPFTDNATIIVNGKSCRNIFFHWDKVERLIQQHRPSSFCLIHGDCTFSNIMLRDDCFPVLIDPRGYFGHTELYGDPAYDWVKLYYSLYSNYDQFNLGRFDLSIQQDSVEISIASSGWECMEDDFFAFLDKRVTKRQMRLLLSIVWLSLTTYAWQDYDSICGAFYYGLYLLEDVL